jgi:hypothetical protein
MFERLIRPPSPAGQQLENIESIGGQWDTTERYCWIVLNLNKGALLTFSVAFMISAPEHFEHYGDVLASTPQHFVKKIVQSAVKYRGDEGDPWSVAPHFTDNFRRERAARFQRYLQKGIFSSLDAKNDAGQRGAFALLICYKVCFLCCTPFCSDIEEIDGVWRYPDGTMANKLDRFWSMMAARVPRSWGEVCYVLSFNGFLLNRHRLMITIAAIMGLCAALVSSYTDSADEHPLQDTNATIGSVYAFLDEHCDQMPNDHYDGAHFDFWTIWLLISLYCGASITFVLGKAFYQAVRRCCTLSSQSGLCLVHSNITACM